MARPRETPPSRGLLPSEPDPSTRPERVAVVGSGVAGLTAAYVMSVNGRKVTLYEADPRLGGHAHTHDVPGASGNITVDSGFIVHNDRTYPLLRRLFSELGVAWRPTEMSMSIRDEASGLVYAGGRGPAGFLARPRQLFAADYRTMLSAVRRFHTMARRFLAETDDEDETSFGTFVAEGGFPESFVRLYAVPLVSCVWSTGGAAALDYPARYLFRFLDHHGMLSVGDSPTWATVIGGSRSYVRAIANRLQQVHTNRRVTQVRRHPDRVELTDSTGAHESYDRVVIATHPDQALGMLADPTRDETRVLGAFRYSTNQAVLHRDPSLMPQARLARASWNYLVRADSQAAPLVTYWMNRLQGLPPTDQVFVTLNGSDRIEESSVIATMNYRHPIYDVAAVRAQRGLADLTTPRSTFAGAYHGWGFHEDGARSGLAAARAFGATW